MDGERLLTDIVHLIDAWLAYQVYARDLPSLSVGIKLQDRILYRKSFGMAHLDTREPAGPNTVYRIASHSKLFTATALMRLRARGVLDLDDPVARHIKWLQPLKDPALEEITLRRLLTHSSGVNRDGDTFHWTYDEPFPDRESLARQLLAGVSVFPAGETWKYSNLGFALLGMAVEGAAGMPYEEVLADLVSGPLGLQNTAPFLAERLRTRAAAGYSRALPGERRRPFPPLDTRAMNAAAGFCSTVDDMLAFYDAHRMGNPVLLSDEDKALMQQVHFRDGGIEWGLGFAMRTIGNLYYAGHGGRLPGYLTFSGLNQKHGLGIVVMANAVDGQAKDLFAGISHLLYYVLEEPGRFLEGAPDYDAERRAAAGLYRSLWGFDLYGPIGSRLVGLNPDLTDPASEMDIFDQVGPLSFRIPGRDPIGPIGEMMAFTTGVSGRVDAVRKPGRISRRFEIAA